MSKTKSLIILGIDPGLATTGYAIIFEKGGELSAKTYGCIITSPRLTEPERLEQIYRDIAKIIKKNRPDIIAIEKLFFCRNVKTALQVGQARGILLLAARQAKKSVKEFTPLQVKQTITGYGQADKKQIKQMVKVLLNLNQLPRSDDAADALAIAICGAHHVK